MTVTVVQETSTAPANKRRAPATAGPNESARLEALRAQAVLDTPAESIFDDLVRIAAALASTPIALISLVDEHRQWFKARVGIDLHETAREDGFCTHTISRPGVLVVPDALEDPRFADSPLVTSGPRIRFYAGAPIVDSEGHALGTLSVLDRTPRTLGLAQQHALLLLARHVATRLDERRRRAVMHREREEHAEHVRELHRAYERQEFDLLYQPKVDLRDARLRGLEALIRWRHPDRGLIAPGDFIPALEQSGLILKVGHWVMQTAAQQHRRWTAAGLQPPRIAINVSPHQLRQPDFAKGVAKLLSGAPRGESPLDIELTESVFVDNLADGVQKLHEVRALGVRVAIDDFGIGYSSLGYLARLPIDYLKVDRSFVAVMTENPNDMAIVSSIISLAHGLNLKVIAEGVETVEQRKLLQLLRCDQMQGYLYSAPVAVTQIEELLHAESAFGTGTMRVLLPRDMDDEPG